MQPVQAVTHVAAQPVQVAQPAAPVVAQPVQAAQTATQATTQPMAWPPWGYSGDLATGSTWGKMWLPGTSPWSSSTPSDPVMVGTKTFAEFQLEEATRLAREGVTFEDVQVAEAMQLPEGKTTRSGMEH